MGWLVGSASPAIPAQHRATDQLASLADTVSPAELVVSFRTCTITSVHLTIFQLLDPSPLFQWAQLTAYWELSDLSPSHRSPVVGHGVVICSKSWTSQKLICSNTAYALRPRDRLRCRTLTAAAAGDRVY